MSVELTIVHAYRVGQIPPVTTRISRRFFQFFYISKGASFFTVQTEGSYEDVQAETNPVHQPYDGGSERPNLLLSERTFMRHRIGVRRS